VIRQVSNRILLIFGQRQPVHLNAPFLAHSFRQIDGALHGFQIPVLTGSTECRTGGRSPPLPLRKFRLTWFWNPVGNQ